MQRVYHCHFGRTLQLAIRVLCLNAFCHWPVFLWKSVFESSARSTEILRMCLTGNRFQWTVIIFWKPQADIEDESEVLKACCMLIKSKPRIGTCKPYGKQPCRTERPIRLQVILQKDLKLIAPCWYCCWIYDICERSCGMLAFLFFHLGTCD